MDPAYIVLLLAVAIAVVAIAGYLIAIALILKHVVNRLVTILGAVEAVTETAQPAGAVIDEINRDLDAGRKVIENGVERLAESREPVGATAAPAASRHAAAEPAHHHGGTDTLAEAGGVGGGTATAESPPGPSDEERERLNRPPEEEDRLDPRTEEDRPGRPPQGRGRGWWNR